MSAQNFTSCGDGIYRESNTGNYYERLRLDGRRTWRKLDAHNLKLARELASARRTDHARAKHGLAKDPYAPHQPTNLAEILGTYEKAGCPDRHGQPRSGIQLTYEIDRLAVVSARLGTSAVDGLNISTCHNYWQQRSGEMREGTHGGRAVDLELNTLANALRYAVARGKLAANPIAHGRPRFRKPTVRHCRDAMPADAAELHALAARLFEVPKSEVLGWQLLLEALTGCRTIEVLRLRWDAAPRQPGCIDGDHLWIARAKGGVNPFVLIHPALKECIAALRKWREKRFPKSFWWLPSPRNKGSNPVNVTALTHALGRIGPLYGGGHRTSHGLRAYYVTVRRSQGISDSQIAAEIGDSTGAAIISTTYGAVPPNWSGGKGLDWKPRKGDPAWTAYSPTYRPRQSRRSAIQRQSSKSQAVKPKPVALSSGL